MTYLYLLLLTSFAGEGGSAGDGAPPPPEAPCRE